MGSVKGKQGFQRMTHDEFIQKTNQNNKIKIIGRYRYNKEKVDVECKKCGYQWKAFPSNILRNTGCPVCSGRKKRTTEEFISIISEKYPYIEVIDKYIDSNTQIRVRCKKDDYEWDAIPTNLVKHGCPVCNGTYVTTTSFKNEIHQKFPDVEILSEWNGIKGKIKCHCKKCNYNWEVYPRAIRINGCPRCNGSVTRKLTHEEYIDRVNNIHNKNVIPLEGYVNMNTPILHKCIKHNYEYKMKPSHVLRGQACKYCAKEKQGIAHRMTLEDVKLRLFEMYGDEYIILSDNYIKSDDKMLFQHNMPDGTSHTFMSSSNAIFNGEKCGACRGLQVSVGYNDFNSKCLDLAKLLLNYNEGFSFSEWSNKTVEWKCPSCSHVTRKKVSEVRRRGLSCPKCSDGISYPNKFMYNCLLQMKNKLDFIEREYRPKWCAFSFRDSIKTGVYDIYFGIDGKEYICELDGGLGHGNKIIGTITKEESIFIDSQKDELAKEHNIHVIRIDCNYAQNDRYEFIKNNILKSELKDILSLDLIDFNIANIESQHSLFIKACNLWNLGYSAKKIQQEIDVHASTVSAYLNKGKKMNLCPTYSVKESNYRSFSKQVICINTNKIYKSIVDAANDYGLNVGKVSKCCRHISSFGGCINGQKLIWMYLDEYENMPINQIK